MEGLEARLATLTDGVADIPTAEGAVEQAQVGHSHNKLILQLYILTDLHQRHKLFMICCLLYLCYEMIIDFECCSGFLVFYIPIFLFF